MTTQALDLIAQLRQELKDILDRAINEGDATGGFERVQRWRERAARQIGAAVSPAEGQRLANMQPARFFTGSPIHDLQRRLQGYDASLSALAEEVERDPGFFQEQTSIAEDTPGARKAAGPHSRRVFVVHGHDKANTLKLQAMLRQRFNLDPIVMSGAPGRGRTLIEKFEQLAADCSFAFALLTPDDEVSTGSGEYTQARPNVVFELGWFYGRLGRGCVLILFREGTHIHSDLDGVSRVQFIRPVDETIPELERELEGAGIFAGAI